MKLLTIALTLSLLAVGFGTGYMTGHYQGRDEIYTLMLSGMSKGVASAMPMGGYNDKR